MSNFRKLNGIFWDDVSVFKDNAVLKKFKSDQADWSDADWVRFHKELISYYLINKWTKAQAEKKATDIVYTDYMNRHDNRYQFEHYRTTALI